MAEAAAGETEQQEPGVQQQQSEEHGGDVAVQLSPHGLADADEGGPDAAAAEVAEYELGEAEWEGTPATPLGHGEEDEATAALQVGRPAGSRLVLQYACWPGSWGYTRAKGSCHTFCLPGRQILAATPAACLPDRRPAGSGAAADW